MIIVYSELYKLIKDFEYWKGVMVVRGVTLGNIVFDAEAQQYIVKVPPFNDLLIMEIAEYLIEKGWVKRGDKNE